MKHLKKWNEALDAAGFDKLKSEFKSLNLSPRGAKLPVSKLYKLLIIELDREIEFYENQYGVRKLKTGRFITIDVPLDVGEYKDYMKISTNLDSSVKSSMSSIFANYSDWEGFKEYWGSELVHLLDYNDINFLEIENMLLEWEVNVENIWAVLA